MNSSTARTRTPAAEAGSSGSARTRTGGNAGEPARWMGIDDAAGILGVPVVSLRRTIERNARKQPEGSIEARVDGVVARKLGRLWRVALDPAWLKPTG